MKRIVWLLAAAILLALAAGALLSARRLPEGVSASEIPAGTLYSLGEAPGAAELTLPEDEAGHAHTLTGGGSAALILADRGENGRGQALELVRRGVTVLLASDKVSAGEAWSWLTSRDFVRIGSVALIAGSSRGAEALTLASDLVGGGRECAALVLAGDDGLLSAAGTSPARNILFLSVSEPSLEAAGAFLGDEKGPGTIRGYFGEGTARSVVRTGTPRLDAKEALLPVIDWLGSSLGHTVELHDEDLVVPGRRTLRLAGELLLLAGAGCAAGGALALRAGRVRRKKRV